MESVYVPSFTVYVPSWAILMEEVSGDVAGVGGV